MDHAKYDPSAALRTRSEDCEKPRSGFGTKAQYLQAARLLLGSYRTGEANDPEVYVAGVVCILSSYPMHVVQHVVDPMDGLPGKLEWLPKFNEIKKACDEIYTPIKKMQEWEERSRQQLRERRAIQALPAPKQSYGDFLDEMAVRGLPITRERRQGMEAGAVMAKFGITVEQWAAIPDLPPNHTDKLAGRYTDRYDR